jgi:catechol 2,3-dioxygenase-like lactoylglutathione lyase family enzyme
MANIKRIFDVAWLSDDVERCAAFYDKLGFRRDDANSKPPRLVIFEVGNQDIPIHVGDEGGTEDARPKPGRRASVSIIVEDLNAMVRKCEENGIEYWGPGALYAGFTGIITEDPDGRRIRFFQEKK